MYLHLGQNTVVPEPSIIGVFDLDNTTGSHITRKFLSDAEKAGNIINVSDELPKSFVICSAVSNPRPFGPPSSADGCNKEGDAAGIKVYLSQLSSQTLLKRSEAMQFN